jgi:hypothetical protein
LRAAFEESEAVVELEGERVGRLRLELGKVRQDNERRLSEMQEEFETIK